MAIVTGQTVVLSRQQIKDMRGDLDEIRMADGRKRFNNAERAKAKKMLVDLGAIEDSYVVTNKALKKLMDKLDTVMGQKRDSAIFRFEPGDEGFEVRIRSGLELYFNLMNPNKYHFTRVPDES
jgi:hypothetical protein